MKRILHRCISSFILVFFTSTFCLSQNAVTSVTWHAFSNSMNAYGTSNSNSKLLQYNDELNTFSFLQTKPGSYVVSPAPNTNAAANAIVAMTSGDWGLTWDSTCLWSNDTNLAMFPQGAIYNPPGNTNSSNAYIVGSGTTKNSVGYNGNWLASKQLNSYNNSPSNVANACQFVPNSPPYNSVGKTDFAHQDFSATDDGKVRTIGLIVDNVNANNVRTYGARILTGSFNSGVFNWTSDSIFPNVLVHSNKIYLRPSVHMAWNEAGTIGYIWFIGCRNVAWNRNMGYQPIVYRSVDNGMTWNPIYGINFNDTARYNRSVLNRLEPIISNPNRVIPMINEKEGVDCTVDIYGNLHIVTTLLSTISSSLDSLHVSHTYSMSSDQESGYSYRHIPGKRPYIYDFICPSPTSTLTQWEVRILDSMSTEAPATLMGEAGYNDNPWLADVNGKKMSIGARIQVSRSTKGDFLLCTWAESDTNFANGARKWNHIPDLRVHALGIEGGKQVPGDAKIILATNNAFVSGNSTMHYLANKFETNYIKTKLTSSLFGWDHFKAIYQASFALSVSNSNVFPFSPFATQTHWFCPAIIEFAIPLPPVIGDPWDPIETALKEKNEQESRISVFPIPASETVKIKYKVENELGFNAIKLFDVFGRKIMSREIETPGNEMELDVLNLSKGVYFLSVEKNGKTIASRKIMKN